MARVMGGSGEWCRQLRGLLSTEVLWGGGAGETRPPSSNNIPGQLARTL